MTTPKHPSPMAEDELRTKIRRVFTTRTHKFPDKKVEIIQEPEVRNKKFIIAPYDKTIDKIERMVNAYTTNKIIEARIDQMLSEAEAHRLGGGKGLPYNFQPRMNKLQKELKGQND